MASSPPPASILIVDDLAQNIRFISRCLEPEGYEFRSAHSGREALESIRRGPPDLVLLDLNMPLMNGLEVCRRIKAMDDLFLPVVLITGDGDPNTKREGLQAGAEDFISKPFEPAELFARIRNLLRIKRLHDELSDANSRMEEELEAVAQLQRSLLPAARPGCPGIALDDFYQPSRVAGGDYLDYFRIDSERFGLAVGDAAGHGPQAAVLMAMTKVLLHMCEEHWARPGRLLAEAARRLPRFIPSDQFVTLLYAVFDEAASSLTLASAGHCRPIRFGPDRAAPELIEIGVSGPLGLALEDDFAETVVALEPEDRILFYTDGIVEAQNEEDEIFGLDRFVDLVARNASSPKRELIERLVGGVQAFAGGRPFRDDCTLLLLSRGGSLAPAGGLTSSAAGKKGR